MNNLRRAKQRLFGLNTKNWIRASLTNVGLLAGLLEFLRIKINNISKILKQKWAKSLTKIKIIIMFNY